MYKENKTPLNWSFILVSSFAQDIISTEIPPSQEGHRKRETEELKALGEKLMIPPDPLFCVT